MLELRPSCEHCDKDLPPNARDAVICSFECTFCRECADGVFDNVCPNCGGGFQSRPVRPARPRKAPWWLGEQPAGTERVYRPKDLAEVEAFTRDLKDIDPYDR
jgi:hypothetical protein